VRRSKTFRLVAISLLAVVVLLAGSIIVRQAIPDEYIGAERAYLSQLDKLLVDFDSVTTGQRIALIGSSPVIMGLSAQQIEKATGVPTRNLALNSSRSVFEDYAAMVLDHIKPGDVAIIANPNLRKSPQMRLPLTCVRHFGFECIRAQSGFRPRILEDATILFTDNSFGDEQLTRSPRGDYVFPEKPQYAPFRAKFAGPFPENSAADMAKLAADVRRHGACPIFVLTPIWPESKEIPQWQKEYDKLWGKLDEAGLHNIVVEDSILWSDGMLFHHDEHMSEPGREIWTGMILARLQKNGLPGSCGRVNARSD
jgi:hypothetical protein